MHMNSTFICYCFIVQARCGLSNTFGHSILCQYVTWRSTVLSPMHAGYRMQLLYGFLQWGLSIIHICLD